MSTQVFVSVIATYLGVAFSSAIQDNICPTRPGILKPSNILLKYTIAEVPLYTHVPTYIRTYNVTLETVRYIYNVN